MRLILLLIILVLPIFQLLIWPQLVSASYQKLLLILLHHNLQESLLLPADPLAVTDLVLILQPVLQNPPLWPLIQFQLQSKEHLL